MIRIDGRSRVPIYEQIKTSVEELILLGLYARDEQLPSVRSLASSLAINPNTIQKAYQLMESDGLIYSLPGRGSFIAIDAEELRQRRSPHVFDHLSEVLVDLWRLSIDKDIVLSEVESSYQRYHNQGGDPNVSNDSGL